MENNQKLRVLLALPPLQPSACTAITVPTVPPTVLVTGDREVDTVLWLQQCIGTGHPALIDAALEKAKAIKTPMDDLGKRYSDFLMRQHGSAMAAALGSFGFGDLEDQAARAKEKASRRHEALSRFGDEKAVFAETPAERACKAALRGLKRTDRIWGYALPDVTPCFSKREELCPHTLEDCLYAQAYWNKLYWLRAAWENSGDHWQQVQAHDDYCFAQMAHIKPRNGQEAMQVLEFMDGDRIDRNEAPAILRNLVASGWDDIEAIERNLKAEGFAGVGSEVLQ